MFNVCSFLFVGLSASRAAAEGPCYICVILRWRTSLSTIAPIIMDKPSNPNGPTNWIPQCYIVYVSYQLLTVYVGKNACELTPPRLEL